MPPLPEAILSTRASRSSLADHGLAGPVPFGGAVFVFFNRRRDRIKLLLWDRNGFWLFYKRLERGTFRVITERSDERAEISRAELSMILEGIDLKRGKIRRHFAEGIRIEGRGDDDGARTGSASQ